MPRTPRPIPLAELAAHLGCALEGDAGLSIGGFASLGAARPDELVFVREARLSAELAASAARAVIAPPGLDVGSRAVLRSPTPAWDFTRLVQRFAPPPRPPAGIADGALVDATAEIDPSASIEPGARIGPRCRVGARTVVASGVVLAADVAVGADCRIHPGAVLREDTRVGDRVVLQPGVVLGSDGFGLVPDADGRPQAMAQRGRVVVEDDVEIGANTTVDRATLDETRIRRGAKIDNLVQIAHNCDVGEDAIIVAQTGLSGGTVVGRGAIVMAQAGTTGHLRIGAGAFVGARGGLHHDVPDGARVFGAPAMEERRWHRTIAALTRLPELVRRVRRLERLVPGAGPESGGDGEENDGHDGDAGAETASAGDSERD
ncbi:MAG: UDP-3-O-(3-hydroxymyristoyl)glucosamine N-acyltransferase [Spirochaetaceae bacterium]|nr:UDP-3-O-(3-hydroxymyristoyl)glucosamine N-acyltransferase [Myxococcales bacterium]MCB9726763.1 UDP-3-O-(3-hydroxymyristoyl)glucosamine N-acyltransferase [Spirochaetaceae bacterium]HPG27925.1 UDP-3-O-(3-hydroxymyristoyl)glucosamine N-acyltransferase [Myxococcota bacterium]